MELDNEKLENEIQDDIKNDNLLETEHSNGYNDSTLQEESVEVEKSLDDYSVGLDDTQNNSEGSFGETINLTQKKYKFYTDGYIFSFLIIFFAVFSSFIFVFNYLLHPIKVVGRSMQPTINSNIYYQTEDDEIHCDIVYYMKATEYKNNDIVIVMNTDNKYIPKEKNDEVSSVIKRVIGRPNQKVRFYLAREEVDVNNSSSIKYYYGIEVYDKNEDGEYVNINIDQSYLDESKEMYVTPQEILYFSKSDNSHFRLFYEIFRDVAYDPSHEYIYEVSENYYFVMGDNRNDSTDSRFFGAVSYDDIAGSVRILVKYGTNLLVAVFKSLKSIYY